MQFVSSNRPTGGFLNEILSGRRFGIGLKYLANLPGLSTVRLAFGEGEILFPIKFRMDSVQMTLASHRFLTRIIRKTEEIPTVCHCFAEAVLPWIKKPHCFCEAVAHDNVPPE
jgi:hypothetical protein